MLFLRIINNIELKIFSLQMRMFCCSLHFLLAFSNIQMHFKSVGSKIYNHVIQKADRHFLCRTKKICRKSIETEFILLCLL